MVRRVTDGQAPTTTSAAATAAPAKTSRRERKTLESMAADRAAPTAGGKVPAGAQTAGVGATLRAAGKAVVAFDTFKAQLRDGIVDGQSLVAYRESRQADFDRRKEEVKASFASMQTAIADGDAVRESIAANLQEIVDLMPADMVAKANVHKTNKDEEEQAGFFGRMKNWLTRKPAPAKINELELDKLLLKQIDIAEAALNSLEDKVTALGGVSANLAASRIEFAQQLEESVNRFNGAVDVLREVNDEIAAVEAEQVTLDDRSREYGANEKHLFELRTQSQEITRYAAFLNDWITNLRDFETTGEQLATLLQNTQGNAERVLQNGIKMLEVQNVTTGVVAAVAGVINSADWTMLVFDTVSQNTTRAVEYLAGRVAAFDGNHREWVARSHSASQQMAGAMLAANIKTEQDLKAYTDQLLADHAAGIRAVATGTTAKLDPGARVTRNPAAGKNSDLAKFLQSSMANQARRAGLGGRN